MNQPLPKPLFFAEIFDGESVWFEQVRLCTRRHRGEWFDHYHNSYTYIFNGAHIDKKQDGILKVHYVDTVEDLRSTNPSHPLLSKEN